MSEAQPAAPRVVELRDALHRVTCQIRVSHDDRVFSGSGTGFFYRFEFAEGVEVLAIITNRHVVDGARVLAVRLNEHGPDDEPLIGPGREIRLLPELVFTHPDPEVDLALIPVNPLVEVAQREGWRPSTVAITAELLPNEDVARDFAAATNVLMVGYPIGLIDPMNNLPVVRRGALSTPYWFDYRGRPDCLVDIACFPGSSGSPVFAVETGMVHTRQGLNIGQSRVMLLGVLYEGHTHNQRGQIASLPIPTSTSVVIPQMVHLGIVVKSSQILGFRPLLEERVAAERAARQPAPTGA